MKTDINGETDPRYMQDEVMEEQPICDLCEEKVEKVFPAMISMNKKIFDKYVKVEVKGVICEVCKQDEDLLTDKVILKLL